MSKRLSHPHPLCPLHEKLEACGCLEDEHNGGTKVELAKKFTLDGLDGLKKVKVLISIHLHDNGHIATLAGRSGIWGGATGIAGHFDSAAWGEEMAQVTRLPIGNEIRIGEYMDAADVRSSHSHEGKEPVRPITHIDGTLVDAENSVQPTRHERTNGEQATYFEKANSSHAVN